MTGKKRAKQQASQQDIDLLAGVLRQVGSAILDAGAKNPLETVRAAKRLKPADAKQVLATAARRIALEDDRVQNLVQMAAMSSPMLAEQAERFGLLVKDVPPEDASIKDAEVVQ